MIRSIPNARFDEMRNAVPMRIADHHEVSGPMWRFNYNNIFAPIAVPGRFIPGYSGSADGRDRLPRLQAKT